MRVTRRSQRGSRASTAEAEKQEPIAITPTQQRSAGSPTNSSPKDDDSATVTECSPPRSGTVLGLRSVSGGDAVRLAPGDVLGRNPTKAAAKGGRKHVDLGLTKENANYVSRRACVVEATDSRGLVLTIPEEVRNNRKLCKLWHKPAGPGSAKSEVLSERLVLREGDWLVFRNKTVDLPYEVVPIPSLPGASTNLPTPSLSSVSSPLPPSKRPRLQEMTNTSNRNSKSNSNNSKSVIQKDTKRSALPTSTPLKASPASSSGRRVVSRFLGLDEEPFDLSTAFVSNCFDNDGGLERPWKDQPSVLAELIRGEEEAWRAPELEDRKPASDSDSDSDSDSEDFTDSEDEDDRDTMQKTTSGKNAGAPDAEAQHYAGLQDMHATLANTYWQALNSTDPHIGAEGLRLLLENKKLPTTKLCGDLVDLVTFGCYMGGITRSAVLEASAEGAHNKKRRRKTPPQEALPFWDGHRLRLAFTYIETVVYRYPKLAYDRFAEAAGSDYWRNALERLYTLTYVEAFGGPASIEETEESSDRRTNGNDEPEPRAHERTEVQENALQASLLLHAYTLRLFHRLLNGLVHRRGHNSPLIRDLYDYGSEGKAACKVAARAMAHLWVEFGAHLWETSRYSPIVDEITETMGKIVALLLQKFVLFDTDAGEGKGHTTGRRKGKRRRSRRGPPTSSSKHAEAADILWNALHECLSQKAEQRPPGKDECERELRLKLLWMESLGNGPLEEELARRLKIEKEYSTP